MIGAEHRPRVEITGPTGPVLFLVAAFLLAFAPLIRAGNRPLPLMILEAAGLLGLGALAWSRSAGELRASVPPAAGWGIAILALAPIAQMIPLPAGWWRLLPGHEDYARVLDLTQPAIDSGFRPLSLHARATEYSWLALLPCLAMFFLVQALERRQVRQLVRIFLAVAVFEAILGMMQAGTGTGSALNLGNPYGGGAATGTYVNKNHFAALMAMALPVMMALWAVEILPPVNQRGEILLDHPRNRDAKLARRILLSMAVVLLLTALLFTRSRAGIGCGLAAFALASLGLTWNAASPQTKIVLVLVALTAALLAAYVGLTPILERFAPEEISLGYEGRMHIAAATLRAALDFLPFGSGLGTFADVFRRYQVDRLTGFIDHAHNDYAEAFLELGVAGVVALALLAIAYLARWRNLVPLHLSRSFGYLQAGAGLGMLAMIVHGAFDFNFHIPANAIYFSFLAGIFLYESRAVTPAGDPA